MARGRGIFGRRRGRDEQSPSPSDPVESEGSETADWAAPIQSSSEPDTGDPPAQLDHESDDDETGERIRVAADQPAQEAETGASNELPELEERTHSDAGSRLAERAARVEADAAERIRSEVAVARKAAEERFAEKLAQREADLEGERTQKAELIEDFDGRLIRIAERAEEAAERVTSAEQQLADEEDRIRRDLSTELEAEKERLRELAVAEANARVRNREAELEEAIASERRISAEAVVVADRRVEAAEERATEAEAASAAAANEARLAAAEWLRSQIKALRRESERGRRDPALDSRAGLDQPAEPADGAVSLATADVEQLRSIGMSAAQAKRALRYRDRRGLDSVAGLEDVPGFPRAFVDQIRGRLRD